MRSMSSLVAKLANNHPDITFVIGDTAHWSHSEQVVYYNPAEPHADWVLLHETAHALLHHSDYTRDIELVTMERDAWNHAVSVLAPQYDIMISTEFVDQQLDTYRDWLHAKSTCPTCQSTGYEASHQRYTCVHCGSAWQTNIGINTEIRRFATA